MEAFLRALSLILLGVLIGAVGMLFFTPSFNVVVSRAPGALKPVEFATAPVAPAVAPATPAKNPARADVAVAPVKPPVAADARPSLAPAAVEPTIDFKAISEHLILWPTSVTVKTATTVPVLVDGKKVQDLALEAGTILQVSKVLANGSLEVRAKGAKFEVQSPLTDFSLELGKRVSELVLKGTKFDSPFANPPTSAPAAVVVTAAAVPAPVVAPKAPLSLAQRVDVLFGAKPAGESSANPPAAAAPSVPPPAAADIPATPPPAAPSTEPNTVEKGKDLDRKINQLFK